jgi:hypothetical protein
MTMTISGTSGQLGMWPSKGSPFLGRTQGHTMPMQAMYRALNCLLLIRERADSVVVTGMTWAWAHRHLKNP